MTGTTTPNDPKPHLSSARSAASGMVWITIALFFSKTLSFFSQIFLGHVLEVETFAIFALVTSALALVAGFQNSGINKALIQQQQQFDDLVRDYSAFAFVFGVLGTFVLLAIAMVFQNIYDYDSVFWVIAITSLTIPLVALNSIRIASMSIQLRFRAINLNEMKRALFYYTILVTCAYVGAGEYTVAIATLSGVVIQYMLLLRLTPNIQIRFRLSAVTFFQILKTLKWVVLTGFLASVALRSDFLALAKLITPAELGYYSFGFMLVTSVTIPLSAGINQIFMPIFAKLQKNQALLRQEIIRFSSAIIVLGGMICVFLVGINAAAVHVLWGGKWDPASVVITIIGMAMPFRFLATISAAGLEAGGYWRLRNSILAFEGVLLFGGAWIAASYWGLFGGLCAAAVQRIISGILGYSILAHTARIPFRTTLVFWLRNYVPFGAAIAFLFYLNPARSSWNFDQSGLGRSVIEALLAMFVYFLLVILLNRTAAMTALRVIRAKIKK